MNEKAFLLFTLGPVQGFIKAARSVRDLWSGSYLLSYLTYRAMAAVAEKAGDPNAIIFPNLLELPLWKWAHRGRRMPAPSQVLMPCIPNRFLAEVPSDSRTDYAEIAKSACSTAWSEIAEPVRKHLHNQTSHDTLDGSKQSLWLQQINSFWEIYAVVLAWTAGDQDKIAKLLAKPTGNAWADRHQIAQKMLAAVKSQRHFPAYRPEFSDGHVPAKDNLLGTLEHVGPGNRQKADVFWLQAAKAAEDGGWHDRGSKIGRNERLCAVSLVKRFAWSHYFSTKQVFDINTQELRYEDTATIAAAKWLSDGTPLIPNQVRKRHHKEGWSGQWLHWASNAPPGEDPDEDRMPDLVSRAIQAKKDNQGRPPTYYVLFQFDADEMGGRFNGVQNADDYRKISRTLGGFSLNVIEPIVSEHQGELIYAGGDDALCMLPAPLALRCIRTINTAFAKNWADARIAGPPATISGGVVVAHYKEDLRFVLEQARKAEKTAKDSGRNALCLTVCRRSGEHTSALVQWDFLSTMIGWTDSFLNKASDRWAYHLREEQVVLNALSIDAIQLEIKRQLRRAEDKTKQLFDPEEVAKVFVQYKGSLQDFVTLVLASSFLARGRDA